MTVPTLIVTGPIGAGKTSVVGEISHVLAERGLPHGTGDMDSFSEFFPRPLDGPFGVAVSLRNLAGTFERLSLPQIVADTEDRTVRGIAEDILIRADWISG